MKISDVFNSTTLKGATALLAGINVASGAAPAFIGPLPLPNITKISVAASHKALKFRSKGPVFLAYQSGEYEGVAIRLTTQLTGPSKWLWYGAIWDIFLLQRAQVKRRGTLFQRSTPYGPVNYTLQNVNGVDKFVSTLTRLSERGPVGMRYMISTQGVSPIALKHALKGDITKLTRIVERGDNGKLKKETIKVIQEDIIYHMSLPFVSKDHVLMNAYIESIIEERDALTSDKIEVTLMIREFRKDIYEQLLADPSYVKGGGKISIIQNYKIYLLMNNLMSVGASSYEYNRLATMRRIDWVDLIWQDADDVRRLYMFWGSEPLEREVIDLEPKIDIYDPEEPDESDPIDVSQWYYFDFSKVNFPIDVSIDTRDFGGEKKYSLGFYLVDEHPRNQYGYYEKVTHLMCIVKDEDDNITDHFRVVDGIIYRIGDGNIQICFDQLELRYALEVHPRIGHTVTGRWTYQ
ncbi:hypothetical protein DRH29_03015 [candidate division Kazan bacterium]|mgnify:CR=1 FL=1|uniref:Uncharacterized protein n=1 Tax=candidate division Kazan bacterium TaxID=2202143 RepID=A0A420ZCB8_UNCK3|nr:MAG: hypothetical protein DRH29_03015 [candidate division Kazan bacterium]